MVSQLVVLVSLGIFVVMAQSQDKTLTLLKGGVVYSPDYQGPLDILVGGNKILQMAQHIDVASLAAITSIVDCSGKFLAPGLVDIHMHVTGGGGEKGPYSRTPEAKLDQVIEGGITSLVGLLGTDGISRSLPNLLTKLKSFDDQGLSTYMWSGNYHVPPPTLTGSYMTDIMLIDRIVGFGEIAIADHRSSVPTFDELSRIAADARVAGMLSGKAGLAYFHVGSGKAKIDQLFAIVDQTDIPITQLLPTHMSDRGDALLTEGIKWLRIGGRLDLTADGDNDTTTAAALLRLDSEKVPFQNVSMSSDAYGSNPVFNSAGVLIAYDYMKPANLYNTFRKMVLKFGWKIEKMLPIVTKNPATFLGIPKGELLPGRDADILILDSKTLDIDYVYSKGQLLKTPTWIKPPMFDCV